MHDTSIAVVLAAGMGTRLRPLTDDRPKALMDVGGETILGRAVRLLIAHGVQRIVVATGYREHAIKSALEGVSAEVVYCPNPRYDTTQNVVSLALCRSAVSAGAAWFKLDGDVVFDSEVLGRLQRSASDLAAAVDSHRALDREAMKVEVAEGGRIVRFGKALDLGHSFGESIGIERIAAHATDKVFDALDAACRAGDTDVYYEDVYSRLIEHSDLAASAVEVGDLRWTEVDTFEDLERARSLVRR